MKKIITAGAALILTAALVVPQTTNAASVHEVLRKLLDVMRSDSSVLISPESPEVLGSSSMKYPTAKNVTSRNTPTPSPRKDVGNNPNMDIVLANMNREVDNFQDSVRIFFEEPLQAQDESNELDNRLDDFIDIIEGDGSLSEKMSAVSALRSYVNGLKDDYESSWLQPSNEVKSRLQTQLDLVRDLLDDRD